MRSAEGAIDRIVAADASALLERLQAGELIQRGGVVMISVEAIRARAGARWERKRADVWAYVQRKLAEYLSFQDVSHRVGETDFLIAMTGDDAIGAQGLGLRVLEEVLVHFLGEAVPGDIAVKTVTGVEGGRITSRLLDPAKIQAAVRDRPPTPEPKPFEPEIDPVEEKKRNPVSFVTATGTSLRIDFAVEHLISLKHNVTAALRIEPTVTEVTTGRVIPTRAFAKLSDDDVAFIDQATVDFGSLFLPKADGRAQPALVLPVSFRTMMARKGRHTLIAYAGTAPERVKASVMVELVDVDRGTPASRLIEVVGLIGSLCRGVFIRLQPIRDATAPLTGTRLMGVTLDASDLAGPDTRIAAQILEYARRVKGSAPAMVIQGLPNDRYFAVAEAAGLSHAGVRAAILTGDRASPQVPPEARAASITSSPSAQTTAASTNPA